MKKNRTLTDLNDFLFNQLDRLNNDELDAESLAKEIDRTKAMTAVSQQVIHNAHLVLEAQKILHDRSGANEFSLPELIGHSPASSNVATQKKTPTSQRRITDSFMMQGMVEL